MIKKRTIQKFNSFIVMILLFSVSIILPLNINVELAKAGSTWTDSSEQDFNNGTINNLTIKGTGMDAELMNEFSDPPGWYEKKLSTKPNKRESPQMASIHGTDKVLLFGGRYSTTPLGDTWVYDLSENKWTNMNPINPKPNATYGHSMASIHGTDKVILFAAVPSGFETFMEIWIFDLSDNTWIKMNPSGSEPDDRSSFIIASIYGTKKVLLFGGRYGTFFNDTWVYDLNTNNWTNLDPLGSKPTNRANYAMATIYGTDKVMLYAGYGGTGVGTFNDTWIYDLSDNIWIRKWPAANPGLRYWHAMASIYGTDNIVLYGSMGASDGTWLYDLSENTWTKKFGIGYVNPGNRWYHAMATVYGTDYVLLFTGKNYPDDTWLYKHSLISKNGTFISAPYDTGANSSFKTISWYANMPAKTSLNFQLRTSDNESNLKIKNYIGPDGTNKTFYNISGTTIWTGHNDDQWIQYKAYLNISVNINYDYSPVLKEVTISYNCLPNTIGRTPANGSVLKINDPKFRWIFEDFDSKDQKAFQLLISNDTVFENVTFDTGELITTEQSWQFTSGTNFNTIPDGTWYWKVRTSDEDGAWTEYCEPRMIKIDTQLPNSAITTPVNNGFYNNLPTITGIANDPMNGLGLLKIALTINRLRDNYYWNGTSWISNLQWLNALGTTAWTYDSSSILWETNNKYSVRTRASDNASNIELTNSESIFSIDLDKPHAMIGFPKNNVWLNKLNMVSGTSFDFGGSDVDYVEISIKCVKDHNEWDGIENLNDHWDGTKWNSAVTWLTVVGADQWIYNTSLIPWTTGNYYNISARAIDNTGNLEINTPEIKFMYDAKPPDQLSLIINNDDKYTTATTVNLSLTAKDIGSGISGMSFQGDWDWTYWPDWSTWEPFNESKAFELLGSDGEKTVYFLVQDHAGNIAEVVLDTIIMDTTPPEKLSIIINEDAKFSNSNQVDLALNAMDLGSGLDEMAFSFDSVNWLSWEPFRSARYISFPPDNSDGKRTIYFRVKDKAGNIAKTISDSITLDRTPPHNLIIVINNGVNETNSTLVTLTLFAQDNTSGVQQISFSIDGSDWSVWEDYIEKRPFYLQTGNSLKTIYFKVKDNAENIANPVVGTILLNITSPEQDIIQSSPSKKESSISGYWYILIILIILLIIVFIIGMTIFKKQTKRIERRLLLPSAVTVKPGLLPTPTVISTQVPPAPETERLPSSTVSVAGTQKAVISTTTIEVPKLPKITQTQQAQAQVLPTTTPKSIQLEQLPPATSPTLQAQVSVAQQTSNSNNTEKPKL